MITEKKNLFKSIEKFRCVHDVHRHFKSQMSTYHILIEKNCYPDGCVYFQWKCRLLAKQKKCFRNFKKVGKNCTNCKYFYEEKIHQYPEFDQSHESFADFQLEFQEFLEWINHLKHNRVSCEGRISSVKPDLWIEQKQNSHHINVSGFLIAFSSGYIDNLPFEDPFYLSVSSLTQDKLKFKQNDLFEFDAKLNIDRGRLVFRNSGKFYFIERGNEPALNKSNLLVTLATATVQTDQPAKCLNCSQGILADVNTNSPGPRRSMVCMMGAPDYRLCTFIDTLPDPESNGNCANPAWKGKHCNYTI